LHSYELWAVWGSKCWKCEKPITVTKDTAGWSFNPFVDIGGDMWSNSVNENTIRILNKFNVKMELRYSKTLEDKYIANVCPYCNNIQGNWFINEEFMDIMYNLPEDFKLILIDNGKIADTLSTIEEFESKHWEFFLNHYLKSLKQCHICKCYISDMPEHIEKYQKYEGAQAILGKYGKIRKLVTHHISYKDNITIDICSVCHAKIHNSKDSKYAKFRPVDDRRAARNGMKE
jgi:hypothetical protein